jgi:hypothetical protein
MQVALMSIFKDMPLINRGKCGVKFVLEPMCRSLCDLSLLDLEPISLPSFPGCDDNLRGRGSMAPFATSSSGPLLVTSYTCVAVGT